MIRKLLVAYDGSEGALAAFDFGLDLAQKYKAVLTALAVVRLPEPPEEVETEAVVEAGKARYQKLFKALQKRGQGAGIEVQTHVQVGHPAEQIVQWAQEHHADAILLGHHSRSKLGRWLLGGTADRVMDHAACSVLVVKGKAG